MKTLLIIGALCFAGCATNPSLTRMSGPSYRVNDCYGDNKLQCSRLVRQVCPDGFIVLNPSTAETKGPIILCSNAE